MSPSSDILSRPALVLNRSWQPIHVTTVVRALVMLWNESAKVVDPEEYRLYSWADWMALPAEEGRPCIRTARSRLRVPEVVALQHFDRLPMAAVAFSRRNVAKRDHYTCQYCGDPAGRAGPDDRPCRPAGAGRPVELDQLRRGLRGRATPARPTGPPIRPGCGSASSRPGPSGSRSTPCRRSPRPTTSRAGASSSARTPRIGARALDGYGAPCNRSRGLHRAPSTSGDLTSGRARGCRSRSASRATRARRRRRSGR